MNEQNKPRSAEDIERKASELGFRTLKSMAIERAQRNPRNNWERAQWNRFVAPRQFSDRFCLKEEKSVERRRMSVMPALFLISAKGDFQKKDKK